MTMAIYDGRFTKSYQYIVADIWRLEVLTGRRWAIGNPLVRWWFRGTYHKRYWLYREGNSRQAKKNHSNRLAYHTMF